MTTSRLLPLLSILAFACAAAAQNSRNDAPNLVFRDRVEPHWFAGADGQTNRFWYRVNTGKQEHEFTLVNAAQGKRAPAFDHARVAESLAKITGC